MEDKDFFFYEFGEFHLDSKKHSLSKNGEKIQLTGRNFDLLLFMVENCGRILDHEELLDKVWAGTFVEQTTINKAVSMLRQILEEKPESEFIKTIPRRGYSFISPVRVVSETDGLYVRETAREIIVEEYEETDDAAAKAEIIENQSAGTKALPAANPKKNVFFRPPIFLAAGIVLLFAAFFGFKFYFSKNVSTQFSVENVHVSRITNNGKIVGSATVSPDGNYLLYPTVETGGAVLWLRQILANSATRLTMPAPGSFWASDIAPDNSYVYYIFNNASEPQRSGLYKIPMLGGEPQRIAENVGSFAISPDGKQLALVRLSENTEILTVDANGENTHTVTTLPANFRLWSLGWTPDGAALLCTIRKTSDDKMQYYVTEITLENGREKVILPPQEKVVYGATWLPDKSALLAVVREMNTDSRQIWQYFPDSLEWRRVTNDNNSYKAVSLTRDGKTIVSTQERRLAAIWRADEISLETTPSGKKSPAAARDKFRQITDIIGNFDRIDWLADNRLMYSLNEDRRETIFTINADGTNPRPITGGEDGFWMAPSVAGNGQNISFLSSRSGAKEVWRIDPDGKNPTRLTDSGIFILFAHIMRDNATIIYSGFKTNDGARLFKQTPDGQTAALTESDTGVWAISPDEKLLAVVVQDKNSRTYRVEVRTLDDGKILKTFDFAPDHQITFTPDGKNLTYDKGNGSISQIIVQPLDGDSYALTDFQTDNIFSFAWSPAGKRLAVNRGQQLVDAVQIKVGGKN